MQAIGLLLLLVVVASLFAGGLGLIKPGLVKCATRQQVLFRYLGVAFVSLALVLIVASQDSNPQSQAEATSPAPDVHAEQQDVQPQKAGNTAEAEPVAVTAHMNANPQDNSIKQHEFNGIIKTFSQLYTQEENKSKYLDQENNLKKIVAERNRSLKQLLPDGMVHEWRGAIADLGTAEGMWGAVAGEGAHLTVALPHGVELTTFEETAIPLDSALFQKLREYSVGDPIIFSGKFARDDVGSFNEMSLTQGGGMHSPYFQFLFTDFHGKS